MIPIQVSPPNIAKHFRDVRQRTVELTQGLTEADMQLQSMDDASPSKWHLAHTTWFFETFILLEKNITSSGFKEHYNTLFNSYYNGIGIQFPRPNRGLISRPSLQEILSYRAYIDDQIINILTTAATTTTTRKDIEQLVILGCHHEQQHQELLLTDLLHAWSFNPMHPQYINAKTSNTVTPANTSWLSFEEQLINIGHSNPTQFCFDNEHPLHKYYLSSFSVAPQLVTNAQWLEFINDQAYNNPLLWLSDGWACKEKHQWEAPLYWVKHDQQWYQYGLDGLHAIELYAPVCHISYYEANAFATWANARLPTEQEWEHAAKSHPNEHNNLFESGHLKPMPSQNHQFIGDVWEWTQSAYAPYPGFSIADGAVGEYNGKFMSNQYVLRGGSCVTSSSHIRTSYRNFFHPHQRWQFTGLRLAK